MVDCLQKRIGFCLVAALSPEVVQVDGPNPDSGQVQIFDERHLGLDGLHVVIAHPLVAFEGVGTHGSSLVSHNSPTLILDVLTDLKEK